MAAVVGGALTIEASLGFGATLITVTLGSFLLPIDLLMPTWVPLNFLLAGTLAARHRQHIDRRMLLRRILPMMLLGMPIGMTAFRVLDPAALLPLYGAIVIGLSAMALFRLLRGADTTPLPPRTSAAVLLLAGMIHGAFATGGPLVVYSAGRELLDKAVFRATLLALWATMQVILITGFVVDGSLGASSLTLSACLLLPVGLGLVCGEALHDRLDPRTFRIGVFSLLLCAGFALVKRGF